VARKTSDKPPAEFYPYAGKLRTLLDRKRRGRTDSEIAAAGGLSKQEFSRLLKGTIPDPRLSTVWAALRGIGATLCELDRAEAAD
jgi:transcriptional regulator with XRE-family HTH domain